MRKFTITKIVLLILLFATLRLYSQKVVVSEYYNVTGDPQGEWTELLVVEDNVDLVGYTLRDNSGSTPPPSQWTGGIRFKNHPLWRNLRAGTIIVINHRYSPYQSVDVDKRDGYIEIDAENETYFEKRCFSCIVGPEWYQKALNIAQESDILEIIDQNDNHIHALAHMPSAGGDWLNMPDPKIAYVGSIPRGGVTIRVCPGRTLSAYNKGFDTRGEETVQSSDFITKGKPNNSSSNVNQNQLFWRSLREPRWNLPSGSAKLFRDSVVLTWNAMTDPNPQDSLNGYLIVRIPYDLINNAQAPVDSRLYTVGENLGTGVVVAYINYSQATRYVDKFSLQCGVRYVYRIYAFRYKRDDFHEDIDEYSARGIAYNERTFAEIQVEKPIPTKPEIIFAKGKDKVCEGDTIILKVKDAVKFGRAIFKWYADGNLIAEGSESLIVVNSGEYKVSVEDTLGCIAYSDAVSINVVKYPNLILQVNDKIVSKDTTFVICRGESLKLKPLGWFKYKFYKDDQLVEEASKTEWTISSNGTYYFGADNDICFAKTPKVTIKLLNLSLQFSENNVKLFVDKNEVYRDTVIVLTNLGSDTIKIDDVNFTDNTFELLSPKPPFIILPNGKIELLIRFKPLKSGTFSTKVFFHKNCNQSDTLYLEGTKAITVLIYNYNVLSLGVFPNCIDFVENGDLELINDSERDVEIVKAELDSPFEIVNPTFPQTLQSKSKISIKIKFSNIGIGQYLGVLKIVYRYTGLTDSLQIPIVGEISNVDYSISKDFQETIQFSECENSKNITLSFINKSKLNLEVNLSTEGNDLKILNSKFVANPNDTSTINLELRPKELGSGKAKIYFVIEPCAIVDSLVINYYKKGIIVSFDADTIDFGNIYTCFNEQKFSKSIVAKIIGDSLGLTKIKEVKTNSPFKFSLPNDSLLKDGSTILCWFEPFANGFYEGVVKFVLEPCDNEYSLWVRGAFVQGKFTLSNDTVDFGEVEIGSSPRKSITITNIGDTIIFIESSKILDDANFKLNPIVTNFTALPKNDKIVFDIAFEPTTEGNFETVAEFYLGFPCDSVARVVIKGIAKAPMPKQLTLYINEHRFKPSTIVRVPVQFRINGTSMAQIDSIVCDISYRNRVFNVSSVYSGSFLVQSEIDSKNELIRIHLDTKKQNLVEGVIAYLEGMVLIGDQKFSDLQIQNAKVFAQGELIDVLTKNGKVIVDSVCMIDYRLISPDVLPEFTVSIEPNSLTVKVKTSQNGLNADVFLYDLMGRCLFSSKLENVPKGESEHKFSMLVNPYQKYFCLVRYGGTVETLIVNYRISD